MSPRSMRRWSALLLVIGAASCATAKTAPDAAPATPVASSAPAAPAAPREWEPWPPANVVRTASHAAMDAPSAETIRLQPKEGGWRIDDLFAFMNKTTGVSILYDGSNATFKQAKVEFVGDHVIAKDQLFPWLQAVLSYRKLVLVPVGPKAVDGSQQWFVMDQADPNLKSRPVFLDESEILDYADRDGLYVVATMRVRDTVDTTRARNALSPISTATAGIGRIQDIPGRWLIVGDFAPVVASMKRLLDRINAETPPSAVPPAPAPAPAK
jgi:hypothetical protein